jgi:hypothetical protein
MTPAGACGSILINGTTSDSRSAQEAMYSRTQNENGSYNTRCLDCLRVIAESVECAPELDHLEVNHICPQKVLTELVAQKAATADTKRD